jgi:hypothetical protein
VLAVERDPPHRADAHGPRAGLELDVAASTPLVTADADVVVAGHALAQGAGVDARRRGGAAMPSRSDGAASPVSSCAAASWGESDISRGSRGAVLR